MPPPPRKKVEGPPYAKIYDVLGRPWGGPRQRPNRSIFKDKFVNKTSFFSNPRSLGPKLGTQSPKLRSLGPKLGTLGPKLGTPGPPQAQNHRKASPTNHHHQINRLGRWLGGGELFIVKFPQSVNAGPLSVRVGPLSVNPGSLSVKVGLFKHENLHQPSTTPELIPSEL